MRVYLQYEPNDSGKGKFLGRLIPELERLGVKCQYTARHADVTLSLTRFRQKTDRHMPKVLRVDGIHLVDSARTRWRNKLVADSIRVADVVIWQSEFCRHMGRGILKAEPAREVIIFNAAPAVPKDAQLVAYAAHHGDAEKVVALCAKWDYPDGSPRRHKRLREQTEFANWYAGFKPDVEFRIFGQCKERPFEGPRVRYYGHLVDAELREQLCAADVMLCLPYYDWMPNSVVEGIACGLPVIASNNGGQAEVADAVVATDDPMRPVMTKEDHVPGFEFPLVGKVLDSASRFTDGHPDRLSISRVAAAYKNAFRKAMDAR